MLKNLLKSNVAKQVRDFGIGPIAGLLISMLTVPVTTRLVLPEEFGKASLFTLVQTIYLIIALFGLDQAYIRYYNSKEYPKEALLYNSFWLPLLITIILGVISIIFMRPVSMWLYGSYEQELMLLFPPFLISLLINRYSYLMLRMELRGKLYSFLNILSQLLSFVILLVLFLFFEKSFRSIVFGSIFATIINTIIVYIITKKSWVIKRKYYNKDLTKKMLFFALPLVPATIISWLLNSFDKIALKQWSTYEELGLYAAAFKIVSLFSIVQNIFSTSWLPFVYKWHENNVNQENFKKVFSVMVSLSTIMFYFIVFFRNQIFLFLGPAYRETTGIFLYLIIVPFLSLIALTCTNGIDIKKKTYLSFISTSIGFICNLILDIIIVPKLGAKGAALGTAISFMTYFIIQFYNSRRLWIKFDLKFLFINFLFVTILIFIIECNVSVIFELVLLLLVLFYNYWVNKDNITNKRNLNHVEEISNVNK